MLTVRRLRKVSAGLAALVVVLAGVLAAAFGGRKSPERSAAAAIEQHDPDLAEKAAREHILQAQGARFASGGGLARSDDA